MPICNEHVPTVFGGPARDDRVARRDRRVGALRRLRAERHLRSRHPRRRARRVERARGRSRPTAKATSPVARPLPLAPAPHQAQGRQRRRLLPPLGRGLPLHGRARRRQRDDRRMPDDAGAADGSAPRRRHHPDRAARGRPRDAARAASSSSRRARTGRCSRPACTSGSSANRTTGATTRSCAWSRSCAHCALAPLPGSGAAVGRGDVARLRRGGADAPRRLEGLGRRRPRRQLRAGAAEPAGRAAARPPLVPRQPAELAPDVRAGPAPGAPHRVPDRRSGLRVVAALARVPAAVDAAVRADTSAATRPTSSSRISCSRSGRPPTSP